MSEVKVSVIIPVYKVEEYLKKCMDSVLAQDYKSFEIIAVDDGSPDSCGRIIDQYATKYPERVIAIHQENQGQGGARNHGIDLARGEYLLFVDSDDFLAPNMLSLLVSELESNNADVAVCGMTYIDESGKEWKETENAFPLHTPLAVRENKKVISISPAPWNKLYKKSLFTENKISFPSKVWYEDFRAITKILTLAQTVVFTDECPYYYLQRQGSTMNNGNIDRNYEIFDAVDDILEFFKENNLYDEFKEELEYITFQHVFWDSSVRVLKSVRSHRILSDLYNYTLEKFPCVFSNRYIGDFINANKSARALIYFCLKKRLYCILHFILRIKG